jgi:cytochrome c553
MKLSRLALISAAFVVTTAIAQQATTTDAIETAPTAEVVAPIAPAVDTGPAKAGDPVAGQTKAGACAACHGVDGNSSDSQYPSIAGQHELYISRQLKLFKSGERANPIMLGMASILTEQDMRDIGAYYSTQKIIAGLADDSIISAGPNAGKKFYQVGEKVYRAGNPSTGVPACMACHGPAGAGMPGPTYPALGGQHAQYTLLTLTTFQEGMVWGTDKNANVIMSQVAKNLSNEEIQSLATYLQGLHKVSKPEKK